MENGQVAGVVKLIWFNRRWEGILIRLPKADLFGLENKSAAQPISNCASAGLEAAGGPELLRERCSTHTHSGERQIKYKSLGPLVLWMQLTARRCGGRGEGVSWQGPGTLALDKHCQSAN